MTSKLQAYQREICAFQEQLQAKSTNLDRIEEEIVAQLSDEFLKCVTPSQKRIFEVHLNDFKKALYGRNHYEFGKRLERILRSLLGRIFTSPEFQVLSTARNKVGDILISSKKGKTVVVEVKSYIAKDNSAQGIPRLRDIRDSLAAQYSKYLVFAGWSYFNTPDLAPFLENIDWVILQEFTNSKVNTETPVWEAQGLNEYLPFHTLVEKIKAYL